ncbi:MAG: hypothetical protein F4W93_02805 [Dehalococcoidia bacterium]|nr:hypothetical protein [Dehalococcoidia bacterium]
MGKHPFVLSATVDFPDDVMPGPYDARLLDELVGTLRSMGVQRVYWLYYGDVDPESLWAGSLYENAQIPYGTQTLEAIGEPLKAAVPVAHRHGLEIYGVLKPYNTGMSGINGPCSGRKLSGLEQIGGSVPQVIPFLERYPHTRLRRRPDTRAGHGAVVTRIRLLKRDASPTRVRPENLQLWTSDDNGRYTRLDATLSVTERVEPAPREVRNYHGELVVAKGTPVRTLTIDGLNISKRFVAVTTDFTDESGDFINTACGMVEAYGDDFSTPLPVVVASRGAVWNGPRDLNGDGPDFDSGMGHFEIPLDVNVSSEGEGVFWHRLAVGGLVAFAQGKNEYLPGTVSEVYPEVHRLWDGWVDRILETGVDGIDIRVSSHGSLVDEPWEYGFDEPVVEANRMKYDSDPWSSVDDLDRFSRLRGKHFTSFMRRTSNRARSMGQKMQAHIHTEAFRPDIVHGQIMGFPPNTHFAWQDWMRDGLLDGITFRTSWWEALEDQPGTPPVRSRLSNALRDPVAVEALELASELGIPAYMNRYIERAVGDEEYMSDLKAALGDERFAGFDLYESACFIRPTADGSRLEPRKGRVELIRGKVGELGLL